jgi:hypothetical protein
VRLRDVAIGTGGPAWLLRKYCSAARGGSASLKYRAATAFPVVPFEKISYVRCSSLSVRNPTPAKACKWKAYLFLSINGDRRRSFGRVLAQRPRKHKTLLEDFMNKRTHSLWWLITLALLLGVVLSGAQLNAQQPAAPPDQQSPTQPAAQPPDQQSQQPDQQPQQPEQQQQQPGQAPAQSGQQTPDAQAQTQQGEGQIFAGMIVKSGDKYVLQDSASGTTYDVDRQDLVQSHEGKRVRVKGTLDPDGKTIHVK